MARSCVFSVLAKSEDPPRGSVRSLIYVKLINRSICPFSRLCSVEFRRNNARDTDRSNLYELLLGNGFNWPTIFRGISRYHQWFANVRRQRKVRRIQSLTPDQRYRFWSQLPPFYHETNDDINWTRCSWHESDFVVKIYERWAGDATLADRHVPPFTLQLDKLVKRRFQLLARAHVAAFSWRFHKTQRKKGNCGRNFERRRVGDLKKLKIVAVREWKLVGWNTLQFASRSRAFP